MIISNVIYSQYDRESHGVIFSHFFLNFCLFDLCIFRIFRIMFTLAKRIWYNKIYFSFFFARDILRKFAISFTILH